jgi:L-2-hydroxyglutarate oxidase
MQKSDVIVVGGGIVGLATAWQIQNQKPGARVTVLEKEPDLGRHQTGHNSGVLHTGVYYKPGSLKALNCTAGRRAMIEFCQQHGIAHEICGKVIVATHESELDRLQSLFERAQANGVISEMIPPERLAEIEPHVAGVRAMHVPEAGIADYPAVVRKLAELIRARDGQVHTGTPVTAMREDGDGVVVTTPRGEFRADRCVNCAGLHSDRVTRMAGHTPPARIVPFRGEYYKFKPGSPKLCQHLIYPVPDPAFPFLGVHFTRMINGEIEAGPNAVLAFAREGYTMTNVNLGDLLGTLTYPGFLKLAFKYWRTGAGEVWRSLSKRAFVHALQRLVPAVRPDHLEPAPAGVRAQAVARDGGMVDDFLIEESARFLHVCNAPSPAATASLNIAATLAERLR